MTHSTPGLVLLQTQLRPPNPRERPLQEHPRKRPQRQPRRLPRHPQRRPRKQQNQLRNQLRRDLSPKRHQRRRRSAQDGELCHSSSTHATFTTTHATDSYVSKNGGRNRRMESQMTNSTSIGVTSLLLRRRYALSSPLVQFHLTLSSLDQKYKARALGQVRPPLSPL